MFRTKKNQAKALDSLHWHVSAMVDSMLSGRENESGIAWAMSSAEKRDGASTIALMTARQLAEQGRKVALLDADIQAPTLHRKCRIPPSPGLAELLEETCELEDALQTPNAFRMAHTLRLIPAGGSPPRSDPLGIERLSKLLDRLKSQFEFIIVDTPAIHTTPAAPHIAAVTDAVVVIVRSGRTSRASAGEATRLLETAGAKIMGVVLNRFIA